MPVMSVMLEKLIDKNIKAAWYQNGLILTKIRDDKLYSKNHGGKYDSFEEYISDRWGYSKRQGYRLLNASELTQKIAQVQQKTLTNKDEKSKQIVYFLPENESHLRPLIDSFKTDSERVKVWQDVWLTDKKRVHLALYPDTKKGLSQAKAMNKKIGNKFYRIS